MAIVELSMITGAIVEMTVEATSKNLARRESIIRILNKLGLDQKPDPNDFDAIYAHSLIEYGLFKPSPILKFFRNQYIREAFRRSYYENNPLVLEREAEEIINWNEATRKIGNLQDFSPRLEFASFSAVFNQFVSDSRTPSQVSTDTSILSLHNSSERILRRLDRLEGIDEIRLELARLLPKKETRSHLSTLQAEMRGWFNILNYHFEQHEAYHDSYFEWIINVPIRRKRYDRVVVRGLGGEVGLSDFKNMFEAVQKHQADEGWLVSPRRISPAAQQAAKGDKQIFCYTFDELLDEDVDFTAYFEWLEDQVKQQGIDIGYIPLAATKSEFDPNTNKQIGISEFTESNGWLDTYIDQWLDDPAKEHISILGEFGTGKTWFCLHYAWVTLKNYLDAKQRKVSRPRLPIYVPLRDYAKAVSAESLFSEFFFRKHEIPLPGYSAFEQLNKMGKLLLIFDGFDEMASRIDRQQMINNFWELTKVVVPSSKVLLSCRTEHFPTEQESKDLLNAKLKASSLKLTGISPQFEIVELKKLDLAQISTLLLNRTNQQTTEKILSNPELVSLAQRPVLIDLILEALPDIESGKPIDISRVYLYAIQTKIERDIKNERTFTSMTDKMYFMCEISWEMMLNDQLSLNYRQFPSRLQEYFGNKIASENDLDNWHYDMMGQTMLIRDTAGNYMPAHRSLLEWFVAYKYAALLGILDSDFIDVLQAHVGGIHSSRELSWQEYFSSRSTEEHSKFSVSRFTTDSSLNNSDLLNKAPALTYTIAKFMREMVSSKFVDSLNSINHPDVQEFCSQVNISLKSLVGAPAQTDGLNFIQRVLQGISNSFDGAVVSITLLVGREMFISFHSDPKQDFSNSYYYMSGRRGVSGRVVITGNSQIVPNVELDPDYISFHSSTRSMVSILLTFNDHPFGTLSLEHPEYNKYSSRDVVLLRKIVSEVLIPFLVSMAGIKEFWLENNLPNRVIVLAFLLQFGTSLQPLREALKRNFPDYSQVRESLN